MSDTCLSITHVSVTIDDRPILTDLTASIRCHAITAITGMSGCGKTTLLKTLNCSLEGKSVQCSGDITLDGQSIYAIPAQTLRRRVGLIGQKPQPFPFSIGKNMTYALAYHRLGTPTEQTQRAIDCLRHVSLYDEIGGDLNRSASRLSGGQQQRLCIARALAISPDVLLLDEPCSSLDMKNMVKIEDILLSLKQHCTIVIVTHNLSQARRIADDTMYMEDGRIIESGPTEQLFTAPHRPETKAYLQYVQ